MGNAELHSKEIGVVDHQKIDLFPKSCIYYYPDKSAERTWKFAIREKQNINTD